MIVIFVAGMHSGNVRKINIPLNNGIVARLKYNNLLAAGKPMLLTITVGKRNSWKKMPPALAANFVIWMSSLKRLCVCATTGENSQKWDETAAD
jgi:hypothetical protein